MEKYTTTIDLGVVIPDSPENKFKVLEKPVPRPRLVEDREEEEVIHKPVKKKSLIKFYFLNIVFGAVITFIVLFIAVVTFCGLNNIDYEGVNYSSTKDISRALFSRKHCDNTIYAWGINQVMGHRDIPFVQDVNVYLKNRNTVVVSVKEEDVAGYLESNIGYVYFDLKGEVVEINKKLIDGVPLIEGVSFKNLKVGDKVEIGKGKRTACVNLVKYLREYAVTPELIKFDKDGTFGFYTGGVFVDLGISSDIREKCERLPYILPALEGEVGILHMEEWGSENTDIIFEKSN